VADARVVERHFVRHSTAVALLPFGAGQFQNGHRKKGWAFLASEAVLASVSVAAFSTNILLYGASHTLSCKGSGVSGPGGPSCPAEEVDRSAERHSNTLYNVQLISGGLFFAVAAWGIVDALIYMQPLVPLEPAPPAKTSQLSIFPVVVGSAPGPGMSLRF